MGEIILRFILGGAIVSAFAAMGDMLKPKSLAGLFGAAPSVAIATLGLTLHIKGPAYCAVEGRSMIGGGSLFSYMPPSFVPSWDDGACGRSTRPFWLCPHGASS